MQDTGCGVQGVGHPEARERETVAGMNAPVCNTWCWHGCIWRGEVRRGWIRCGWIRVHPVFSREFAAGGGRELQQAWAPPWGAGGETLGAQTQPRWG